jgi:hypothetical protein
MTAHSAVLSGKKPIQPKKISAYGAEPLPNTTIVWMRRLAIAVGIMVWIAVAQQTTQAQARELNDMRNGCSSYSQSGIKTFGRCKW